MSSLVTLDQVSYTIDGQDIIHDVSLDIHHDQIISLIGHNGSGKSTLLKLILGSLTPTRGHIHLAEGATMGYVPQFTAMRRHLPLSVGDFLGIYGVRGEVLVSLMQEYQLGDILHLPLHGLSGGQLQRVLLVQALAHDPDLVLMDEPTAGLDITAQEDFYARLEGIMDRPGRTLIIVSHDINTVYAKSNLVVCLHQGICCIGHPDDQHLSDDIRHIFGEHVLPYHHHHHD